MKKFEKQNVHSPFIDKIWGAALANMELISKYSKGFQFSSCVFDIYSKYEWDVPSKDKKGYCYY